MKTIGERLLFVRGEMKQGAFAKALNINPNTLRNYESGRVSPNQDILERICVQFSVSPEWLLLGTGPAWQKGAPLPPPKHYSTAPELDGMVAEINKRTTLQDLSRDLTRRCEEEREPATLAFCLRCAEVQARLDLASERLYEAMRENSALKEEVGKLNAELVTLKNEQLQSHGDQAKMASAS